MTGTDATYPAMTDPAGNAAGDPSLRDHLPPCRAYDADEPGTGLSFAEAARPWDGLESDAEEAGRLWSLSSSFVTSVDRSEP